MFIGYLLFAIPPTIGAGFPLVVVALATIALGMGLFKGNLLARAGSLSDDPKFTTNRDRPINSFCTGINIGAVFAPLSNFVDGQERFLIE